MQTRVSLKDHWDLDTIPSDLNINRAHLSVLKIVHANFEDHRPERYDEIVRNRFYINVTATLTFDLMASNKQGSSTVFGQCEQQV